MKRFAFLAVVLSLSVASAYAQFTFTSIEYPEGTMTSARGINNRGDVVGAYRTVGSRHAMVIRRGEFLIPPSTHILGANYSEAYKSNDRGDVVGQFIDGDGFTHGFVAHVGEDEVTTLDFPDASDTYAFGINDSGTVAGYWDVLDSGGNQVAAHGFLWKNGEFSQVDYPGSASTTILGINASGDFVGVWYDDTAAVSHAFVFSKGRFISFDAPFPGTITTQPNDINALGHIVGTYIDSGGGTHGFLAVGETFTSIDYPGATTTSAWGINAAGQIVGNHIDPGIGTSRGYLAQPGNKAKPSGATQ